MSPLSVSQFLEDQIFFNFDCVIFDEASQILPEDALTSIMRGKQLIVVGDEKQLPPTRFFMKIASDVDLDENEDEDPRESILEECRGIGLDEKYLRWHYRSKHESLIGFSNDNIYKKIIMFYTPFRQDLMMMIME